MLNKEIKLLGRIQIFFQFNLQLRIICKEGLEFIGGLILKL
jgi:hypothetical protein